MFQNYFDFFVSVSNPPPLAHTKSYEQGSEVFVVHQQLKCRTLPLSSILGNDRTSNPNR